MIDNEINDDLDYKNLYFDLKKKYDKLKSELEETIIENKQKDNELNILKEKMNSKENMVKLNLKSLDKKDFSNSKLEENNIIDNIAYKQTSKKYETYSVDSFRNEIEQGNDLLNELMKAENEEMKTQNLNNNQALIKIENKENFKILSNKKNVNSLIKDIDLILLNIKKKQESLYQTKKMLNLEKIE